MGAETVVPTSSSSFENVLSNSEALQESYRSLDHIELKACVNSAKANGLIDTLSKNFDLVPVGG